MIEPKNYKVKDNVNKSQFLCAGFLNRSEYYKLRKSLYGNNSIILTLLVEKEDNNMVVNVSTDDGFPYAPFYNPNDRHDNVVYEDVVKKYNNIMDGLVKKKILEPSNDEKIPADAMRIKIKYFTDIERIEKIAQGDLIDLRAAEDVEMKNGEFKLIPLGVAMQLPTGYKANVYPRSSTYKQFGIILANSVGQIDESYCGDNDQWKFPAIALRDTVIHKNDRICQFEIQKKQPPIIFEEVEQLHNKDRGGIGSTGRN